MPTTTALKNEALNGIQIDGVQLHSGNPGPAGDQNVISGTMKSCSFASASNGERYLASAVNWTGLQPNQTITHVTFWKLGSPNVLKAYGALQGDTQANSQGEFTLTTQTKFVLNDA